MSLARKHCESHAEIFFPLSSCPLFSTFTLSKSEEREREREREDGSSAASTYLREATSGRRCKKCEVSEREREREMRVRVRVRCQGYLNCPLAIMMDFVSFMTTVCTGRDACSFRDKVNSNKRRKREKRKGAREMCKVNLT